MEENVAAHPLLAGAPPGGGDMNLVFVQDVIEPVTRAAQAVAQARCVQTSSVFHRLDSVSYLDGFFSAWILSLCCVWRWRE